MPMRKRKKDYHYKIEVLFGNRKTHTFRVDTIENLLATCKEKASQRETAFIRAKIIAQTELYKRIIKHDHLLLDVTGKYHYYKQGVRFPVV